MMRVRKKIEKSELFSLLCQTSSFLQTSTTNGTLIECLEHTDSDKKVASYTWLFKVKQRDSIVFNANV
jgi:hypothetical protein